MPENHYDRIIKGIHDNIKKLWDEDTRDFYPIQVKTIYHQEDDEVNTLKPGQVVPNPADVRNENLPAIFYEYGNSRENDGIRKPVSQVGESFQLNVIASINGLPPPAKSLISRMSAMHSAIRMIVQESQKVGNPTETEQDVLREMLKEPDLTMEQDLDIRGKLRDRTRECRLYRMVSATRRQQNIGIMMFTLEFELIQSKV